MTLSKISLMNCQHCGRKIMLRPADLERGFIICSHLNCGATNQLIPSIEYDPRLAIDLPAHGHLTYLNDSAVVLHLKLGLNVLGTSDSCSARVARYMHRGRCYISRRHCSLTVAFDQWTGTLRYQLQDGAPDPADGPDTHKPSLNGTWLNGQRLRPSEMIDVGDGELISLGGADSFQLSHANIDPILRETYRIDSDFNADLTQ
ncbi:FHA domain-containing protein [Fibrella sp. WM1]|uniref:FHA domain-containing protein n=1 Tax=Fibrella musci TaxID=3242485 RepID=UPI00352190AE